MEQHQLKIHIEGMSCVSCAKGIEKALKRIPGIAEVNVNYATSQAIVSTAGNVSEQAVLEAISQAGYHPHLVRDGDTNHAHHHAEEDPKKLQARLIICALLTVPFLIEMFAMLFGTHSILSPWIQACLATLVQFWGGYPFYRASYYSARSGSANMDVLIVIGTTAAYGFSLIVAFFGLPYPLYFESSTVIILLVLFGRWLESKSKAKASDAIEKLLQLQPKMALVERNGQLTQVPVKEIRKGEIVMIRPGENVPVDADVWEGESSVNESMLTGESLPTLKRPGDKIYAGTTNQSGALKAKTTHIGAEMALSAIIRLVEQAQNSKAPIQRLADKISEIFVPSVLIISLLTFFGWWIFAGEPVTALINAVAVLVIACPCALGLATPTVIVVASGRAASLGFLYKEASVIEKAQSLRCMVFDKTGTLTIGQPRVSDFIAVDPLKKGQLLDITLSLETLSQHPLAHAIAEYAKDFKATPQKVDEFQSIAGKGIEGVVNGERYTLGAVHLAKEQKIDIDLLLIDRLQNEGKTVSLIWNRDQVVGYFAVTDQLREEASNAVACLKQLGIETALVTGDHQRTAEAIGAKAGIQNIYARALPQDKVNILKELTNSYKDVGFAGDGINDAPALAASNVGFAMGSGSDIAIEAADITLIRKNLMAIPYAIRLSQAAFKKIKQNLFFAFIYNICGIPLAAFGFLNPIIAAAAMALSSLSVVGNALTLKQWKP